MAGSLAVESKVKNPVIIEIDALPDQVGVAHRYVRHVNVDNGRPTSSSGTEDDESQSDRNDRRFTQGWHSGERTTYPPATTGVKHIPPFTADWFDDGGSAIIRA